MAVKLRRLAPYRLAVPLLAALWLAPAVPAGAELRCEMLPEFMAAYVQNHIRYRQLSKDLEERTIDTFLRRLDPSRTLLLASQTEATEQKLGGVFKRVQQGDCAPLLEVQRQITARHAEVEELVRAFISDDAYEIDSSVELVVDPDKREPPKTPEERREMIERHLHFQMSNYVTAGTPLQEAKQRLIHRYELKHRRSAEMDEEDVYAGFLDSFAVSLDPHSSYLSAEVLEDFQISMTLSLEGIGVALSERDGYAVAERIIPGGAADRHKGLKPKDKIIAVAQDGGETIDIIDMPLREAVSLIRGRKGTKVHLTVLRQGEKTERFPITIIRDKIDLTEQAAKLRFEEREVDGHMLKLAVLELPSFYGDADPSQRQSTEDVARLLRQVRTEKADGLLLDLSRNGGGLLKHAVTISGFFVRKGEIVGIANARGQKEVLSDRDDEILYGGPLVVLTSRVSASAAEILAGALKDYRRALIAGDDHTFGKGTVQTVTALPPGHGAFKITTAMFFRPGGRSTQNDGVAADVVIPSLLSGDDFGEKNQRYSLPAQSIDPFLGDLANSALPSRRWEPITPDMVALLAGRSHQRVAADPEFAEILEKVEEARKNNGVIRLADIIKQQEEANAQNAPETEANAEASAEENAEDSPQVQEAIDVLADLVVALNSSTLASRQDDDASGNLP